MARRRYGRRHRKSFKLPILSLAAVAIPIAVAAMSGGDLAQKLNNYQESYTGIDVIGAAAGGGAQAFHPERLLIGWGPLAVIGLAKKFVKPMVGGVKTGPLPISLS